MGSYSPRQCSGVHLAKESFVELLASSYSPKQVANHLHVSCFSSDGPCQIGRHSSSPATMLYHVQIFMFLFSNCLRVYQSMKLSVAFLLCSISSLAPQVSAQKQSMGDISPLHTNLCSHNLPLNIYIFREEGGEREEIEASMMRENH